MPSYYCERPQSEREFKTAKACFWPACWPTRPGAADDLPLALARDGCEGSIVSFTALQLIMIRRLIRLLYGSTPMEFESATSLEESIRRLSAAALNPLIRRLLKRRQLERYQKIGCRCRITTRLSLTHSSSVSKADLFHKKGALYWPANSLLGVDPFSWTPQC